MSLQTNGWDLIYNVRLDKANALITEKFKTDFKKLEELNTALATALAGGLSKSIKVRAVSSGDYTAPVTPNITETQLPAGNPVESFTPLSQRGIAHISITPPLFTSNGLELNKYTINNLVDAVAEVKLRVNSVTVTSGGKYTTTPTIKFISEDGGAGASFNAIIGPGGVITNTTVVSKGSGYTKAPTIRIEGGGAIVDAELKVIMEPYIEVLYPGIATATPVPMITVTDKNPNPNPTNTYNTTVIMGYGKVNQTEDGLYPNTFLLPPIVYSTGLLNPNRQHPVFYTSFKFANIDKNLVTNNPLVIDNSKASIKKCFGTGVSAIYKTILGDDKSIIPSDWIDIVSYKPLVEPNTTNITTVVDYCLI